MTEDRPLEELYDIVKLDLPLKRVKAKKSGKTLEVFPNPGEGKRYKVEVEFPEFSCLCPKTHQPDFATITLTYIPHLVCVELKALKYFLNSFRNEGHFHEQVTNLLWEDLQSVLDTRTCLICGKPELRVESSFNVRGGTYPKISVGCSHVKEE